MKFLYEPQSMSHPIQPPQSLNLVFSSVLLLLQFGSAFEAFEAFALPGTYSTANANAYRVL